MQESGIFKTAVKLPPAERAAYLDRACGANAALRLEVEGLLRAHEQPGEFLHRPPIADMTTSFGPGPERPGMRVGPYKLLQFLGEGGMGTVFLAEQTEPVRRMVALKIIKPGMESSQVLARFEAERQALALMDHPNIAKVLDAGSTEASAEPSGVSVEPSGRRDSDDARRPDGSTLARGRPYFVMELVKGVPITQFCDTNKLTTRQRLELFIPVCNAIQHAHMKGIIHRDIKPSNVLIALYDGKPVPKVIDFGVAKAMHQPLTQRTLFTQVGQIVGTFEYMSPEQATLNQLDIDTRSDIYALGVMLYELLPGVTPINKERLRSLALDQMLRLIREEEPMRPSVRLSSEAGALAMAAAYRGTESTKLAGLLRGELDWIVMKCLEKERDRRFVTAGSLAQDIERYLRDEPVTACPPSLAYRARKAYRKHKAALSVAAALAVVLLAGVIGSTWQAIRATRAEQAVVHERDVAVTAGREAADERDKAKAALDQLERNQKEMLANQYAWDMQALPAMWEAGNAAEARRMLDRQPSELRHFEWHYWKQKTHTETAVFTLPDAEAQRRSGGIGLREAGWALSLDGNRVAQVYRPLSQSRRNDERATLKVWDVATRKLLLTRTVAEDENSPFFSDHCLALSRDGKVVLMAGTIPITGGPDPTSIGRGPLPPNKGWVRVLVVDSGKVLFDSRKEPSEGRVSDTAYLSRDGRRLVTHETFNPETNRWLTRCNVWDLAAAERKPVTIEGANIAGFIPDGSRLLGTLTVDGKRRTCIWDATAGRELLSFDYMDYRTMSFSPQGTLLAGIVVDTSERVANGVRPKRILKVFDVNTGKELSAYDLGYITPDTMHRNNVLFPEESQVAFSATTYTPAGATNARTKWSILDATSGKLLRTFDDPAIGLVFPFGQRTPLLFSDDGSQLVHAVENVIHTMDRATGRAVHTLRGSVSAPSDMVALPGGKLRTVEAGGTIRDWNLSPVEPVLLALAAEPRGPSGLRGLPQQCVSADGAWVAQFHVPTGDKDQVGSVRVWDVAGKRSFELTPSPRGSAPSDFPSARIPYLSADGKRVALFRTYDVDRPVSGVRIDPAAYPPPDVTVWDVASQQVLFHREFQPTGAAHLTSRLAAFSPDGTILVIVERVGEQVKSKLTLLDITADDPGKTIEVARRHRDGQL